MPSCCTLFSEKATDPGQTLKAAAVAVAASAAAGYGLFALVKRILDNASLVYTLYECCPDWCTEVKGSTSSSSSSTSQSGFTSTSDPDGHVSLLSFFVFIHPQKWNGSV